MSVFFRPIGSNNVFNFYEDKDTSTNIKTVSYNLGSDGSIKGKWEKKGTIAQLIGAIKSVEKGTTEIISETDWKNLIKEN
jgi:hypothetical protein